MIRVRKSCASCGRKYTFEAEAGRVDEADPGCPDCEPENHEQIRFEGDDIEALER